MLKGVVSAPLLPRPTEVNQLLMPEFLDKIRVGCIKQHRSFEVANIFLIDSILLKYNALSSTEICHRQSFYVVYS